MIHTRVSSDTREHSAACARARGISKWPSPEHARAPFGVAMADASEPTLDDVLRQCAAANAAAEKLLSATTAPEPPAPAAETVAAPEPAAPAAEAAPVAAPAPPAAEPAPVVVPTAVDDKEATEVAMPPLPAAAFFAPPPAPVVLVRARGAAAPNAAPLRACCNTAPHPTAVLRPAPPALGAPHGADARRLRSRRRCPPRPRPRRRPLRPRPPPPRRPPRLPALPKLLLLRRSRRCWRRWARASRSAACRSRAA